jgi:phosphatidate cytidylyltransferase
MTQRVAFGALAIVVVLAVVMADVGIAQQCRDLDGPFGELLRRGSVVPIVWLSLILAGTFELNHILRLKGARPYSAFACLMVVALVVTPWASAGGLMGQGAAHVEGVYWLVVWLLVAGVGTGLVALIRGDPNGMLRDAGATWLIIVYLGFLGGLVLQLRCGRDAPREDGAWLLLILVLVTKASDIGAFFFGSLLGRHKLLPSVSPVKSVEGALGGLLASAVLAMLFVAANSLAVQVLSPGSSPSFTGLSDRLAVAATDATHLVADATRSFCIRYDSEALPPTLRACFVGLAASAAGQIGDLIESCFKRDAGIKDSGRVIPRFGGILDMLDSILFAVPVGWFLLTAVWHVV